MGLDTLSKKFYLMLINFLISGKRISDDKTLETKILESLAATPQTDEVDGFLIRLGGSLRRMPYRDRALLEIKIMQLVFDTECQLNIN